MERSPLLGAPKAGQRFGRCPDSIGSRAAHPILLSVQWHNTRNSFARLRSTTVLDTPRAAQRYQINYGFTGRRGYGQRFASCSSTRTWALVSCRCWNGAMPSRGLKQGGVGVLDSTAVRQRDNYECNIRSTKMVEGDLG